jgi:hypothetical protein
MHVSIHVGVSPSALFCVVDTSYGLGRSLGDCRPGLPKGRKYQMVKTQTESRVRRPVEQTDGRSGFSFPLSISGGRLEFVIQAFGDSLKLSSTGLAIQ